MLRSFLWQHRTARLSEEIIMLESSPTPAYARRFVPADFNSADLAQVLPVFQGLMERAIASADELEKWLLDLSELMSITDEYGSRCYIDKSCHTEDPVIEKRYMQFVEEIEPRMKPLFFALQKKYLATPQRTQLLDRDAQRYGLLDRKWKADVEIFREENVELETQATKLVTDYDKICGAMTVQFEGQEYTMQQMGRFQEKTDRPVRQQAWVASAMRRLKDKQPIEDIFDRLLVLRNKMAVNAGFDDYRALVWKSYKRFDYTPQDCLDFAQAIERTCVPLVNDLDNQRRRDLHLESLRPWDTQVDPKGRPPLEPFTQEQTPVFVEKVRTIFDRMSPALGSDFDSLRRNHNLDLESRKGKQPGGYQSSLEEVRQPFIFMNAAGLQRDVETLLHEGGHAFHCLAAANEPLVFLRSAPMEFCEVASMSMELLGSDHFDVFYNAADAARAKRTMLEGIIRILPWIATIDSFQHWIYTRPGHSPQARAQFWLELLERFGGKLDWSGYEEVRESMWQRQLHLFHVPFYYVEYGIAQLGALQLWLKSRQNPRQALAHYRAALALGGTRPLPELFAAAGIRFDFSTQTLLPLMSALRQELERLPA
jgi:oligoendopeptidase F